MVGSKVIQVSTGKRGLYLKKKPTVVRVRKTYRSRWKHRTNYFNKLVPRPSIQSSYLPFGPSFFARLPFMATLSQATTIAGLASGRSYRLNGPYDPDATGLGGQPFQYDQVSPMYRQYLCYRAKVDIRFTAPTNSGMKVGIRVRPSNDIVSNGLTQSHLVEMGNSNIKSISATGEQYARITRTIDIAKVFGLDQKAIFNDDSFHGSTSGVPSREVYMDVFVIDPILGTQSCIMETKIRYYVKFFDKITQAQS